MRPCTCDRVTVGQPWQRGQCVECWHWHHTAQFRELWGGDPADVAPVRTPQPPPTVAGRSLPCVHEGPVLEWCTHCGDQAGRHVRDCALHERCTREPVGPAVRSCAVCPDYTPDPGATHGSAAG